MEYSTSALIFPETVPSRHGVAELLLFFETLSYYLPTEADGIKSRDKDLFTTLCTGHAPAPLGDDLSRFNRLLREMETSRPDEFARLFSAATLSMSAGQARDQDETSAAGVFSALRKDAAIQTSIRYKERLWQARLILKLAEMLDRREEEVRQGLAEVAAVEQKIFASLEGLAEAATTAPAESSCRDRLQHPKPAYLRTDEPSLATSGLLLPLRLKAWAELYLANSPDLHPPVLVTANPECGSSLLDGYENSWRQEAEKLFSLSIPAVTPTGMERSWESCLASRNRFRAAVEANLEYFVERLRKTAAFPGSAPENPEEASMLSKNLAAWEQQVGLHFPGPETGCKKLDFYCFPGIAFAELFQRLFHLQGAMTANKQHHRTALLAILNK